MWALAMTEPGTGSDLSGMRTTARLSQDGSYYLLNGAKTFITGGVHANRKTVLPTWRAWPTRTAADPPTGGVLAGTITRSPVAA
jgi:hypothetical protein